MGNNSSINFCTSSSRPVSTNIAYHSIFKPSSCIACFLKQHILWKEFLKIIILYNLSKDKPYKNPKIHILPLLILFLLSSLNTIFSHRRMSYMERKYNIAWNLCAYHISALLYAWDLFIVYFE